MTDARSWRLEFNDFERDVAFAILDHPQWIFNDQVACFDIMMMHDMDGEPTDDRTVPLTRADIVQVILLPEDKQRLLNRKFFFHTIAKVMTEKYCRFPDKDTVVVKEVESFSEQHLVDLTRSHLVSSGYGHDGFLWGSSVVRTRKEDGSAW